MDEAYTGLSYAQCWAKHCTQPVHARNKCKIHYQHWYRKNSRSNWKRRKVLLRDHVVADHAYIMGRAEEEAQAELEALLRRLEAGQEIGASAFTEIRSFAEPEYKLEVKLVYRERKAKLTELERRLKVSVQGVASSVLRLENRLLSEWWLTLDDATRP